MTPAPPRLWRDPRFADLDRAIAAEPPRTRGKRGAAEQPPPRKNPRGPYDLTGTKR